MSSAYWSAENNGVWENRSSSSSVFWFLCFLEIIYYHAVSADFNVPLRNLCETHCLQLATFKPPSGNGEEALRSNNTTQHPYWIAWPRGQLLLAAVCMWTCMFQTQVGSLQLDRWIGGWREGRKEIRKDGWIDGWLMDWQMNGWINVDGWMDDGRKDDRLNEIGMNRWMYMWTEGRMNGWLEGWVDGWKEALMDGWTDGRYCSIKYLLLFHPSKLVVLTWMLVIIARAPNWRSRSTVQIYSVRLFQLHHKRFVKSIEFMRVVEAAGLLNPSLSNAPFKKRTQRSKEWGWLMRAVVRWWQWREDRQSTLLRTLLQTDEDFSIGEGRWTLLFRLMDTELIMKTAVTVMIAFFSFDQRERLMSVITAPMITFLLLFCTPRSGWSVHARAEASDAPTLFHSCWSKLNHLLTPDQSCNSSQSV